MRVLWGDLRAWAFASTILSLPLGAAELSRAVPPVEDKGMWHILTRDGPGTTSVCIGDPSSAWCALETYLACAGRRQRALCEQVATLQYEDDQYKTMLSDRNTVIFYRIQWSQLGAPEGMEEPSWRYFYEPNLPPQDPLLQEAIYIELLMRECDSISLKNCKQTDDQPFLLGPVGGRWKVLRSASDTQIQFRSLSPDGIFPRYQIAKPRRARGGAPNLPR